MKRLTRNIGIMAHVDAGKTTLTERMLFNTGQIHKIGDVHTGNSEMDFRALERKHGITISAAATSCDWRDARITIVDTPGHVDFTIEVERSLRVLDSAVAVFSAVAGVEPQSETVWHQADRFDVPRLCFINKMDQVGADFDNAVQALTRELGAKLAVLQLPIGVEAQFCGVVDLVEMQALIWLEGEAVHRAEPIPQAMLEQVGDARERLIELLAEQNEQALEVYLEDGDVFESQTVKQLVRQACLAGHCQPVLCGSAFRNIGVQPLLDAVVDYCPSPEDRPAIIGTHPRTAESAHRALKANEPFLGLVSKVQMRRSGTLSFVRIYCGRLERGMQVLNASLGKHERISRIVRMYADKETELPFAEAGDIVAVIGLAAAEAGHTLCDRAQPLLLDGLESPDPVMEVVVEPCASPERDKLAQALYAMAREDPSLRVMTDTETGQFLLAGMGELHLNIAVETLEEDYNVKARIGTPRVAYREAITAASGVDHMHRKQNGGQGQYARIKLLFEPACDGDVGLVFVDQTVGGAVPKEFVPAIAKSLSHAMHEGVLGYPMEALRVTLVDGDFHAKDSSALAFELAARDAFKTGMAQAQPVLLEPIMSVKVTTPEAHLGAVIGDLQGRRGEVLATNLVGNRHEVQANVPLANMFAYVSVLRSLTHGRAGVSMVFARYAQVPSGVQASVLAEAV